MDIIFCHLVGDYVLQSDYIAKTKGQNMYHLWVHSLLYTLPFCVVFRGMEWQAYSILYLSHFLIDILRSRFGVLNYAVDQILHYVIAFWVCWFSPFC